MGGALKFEKMLAAGCQHFLFVEQYRYENLAIRSQKLEERQTKIHKTVDKVRPLY